ncbi:MAG: YbaB/EbfC family nucleoid-associated protein [Bacteroidota bacterium]
MINLEDIMGEMQKMKTSLQEIEAKTKHLRVTSEAGAGLVKATIDGNKKFIGIEIDESLLNKADKTMLQDLMVAAANLALEKIQDEIKREVGQVAGLPNLLQEMM